MPAETLNSLRIIHNEIFEVAFFTSLLYNITEGVSGYKEDSYAPLTKEEAIKIIETIKNVGFSQAYYIQSSHHSHVSSKRKSTL